MIPLLKMIPLTDKKERTRIFGQYDHLRVYGKDYYFRLQSAGFKAEGVDFLEQFK